MVAVYLLFLFVLIATFTDLQQQKIFNWTTYTGILVAFAVSAMASGLNQSQLSMVGFQSSLLGFIACGGIMLLCFMVFSIGGGDVKLLAMIGAFLGPTRGIEVLLWTCVIGAALAVLILIWKMGAVTLLKRIVQQAVYRTNLGEFDKKTEAEDQLLKLTLYLAPSALLAVTIVHFSLIENLLN